MSFISMIATILGTAYTVIGSYIIPVSYTHLTLPTT